VLPKPAAIAPWAPESLLKRVPSWPLPCQRAVWLASVSQGTSWSLVLEVRFQEIKVFPVHSLLVAGLFPSASLGLLLSCGLC